MARINPPADLPQFDLPHVPQWFKDWLKQLHESPSRMPFKCSGTGIDFQTYAIGSYPPAPLPPAGGISLTDDDHSGPAPTPLRIQIRAGYTALHCGYLLTIDTPPSEVVDLVHFDGGGIIDVFDPGNHHISSKHVPNMPSPTTDTFYYPGKIRRIEIRSANEMYMLQICCRKG